MVDSLLVADTVELLAGGQLLQSGVGEGATVRLGKGYQLGYPVPESTFVQSLLLDGERPDSERVGNRTMKLPLEIVAPGRIKLMHAREQVLELVDQQVWELQYTPDGLLPMVWDCFRASADTDETGLTDEKQDYCKLTLTFQALPYARSTDPQSIVTSSDVSQQAPSVQLDSFESAPGGGGWFTTALPRVEGGKSAYRWDGGTAARAFSAKDLSRCQSVRVWVTMAGTGNARGLHLVLIDADGTPYDLGLRQRRLKGNYAWDQLSWAFTDVPAKFDLSRVTGYYLSVSAGVYLDDLRAMPPWYQVFSSPRGAMLQIRGVKGTARAPANVQINKIDGSAFSQWLIHRPPQDCPDTYTPMIPLDATIAPTGTQQPFPPVDGDYGGLRFAGTYTLFVNFTNFGSTGTRTVTVELRQAYNDAGVTGPSDHEVWSTTVTVDSAKGRLQAIGRVPLPLLAGADDNTATTYTAAVTSSVTTDRISEILLLDTRGETVFVSSARSCQNFWIDEPNTIRDPYDLVGKIIGGTDRAHALSVAGDAVLPSRPLSVDPGDNTWLVFNPTAAPQTTIAVFNRWRTVRLG